MYGWPWAYGAGRRHHGPQCQAAGSGGGRTRSRDRRGVEGWETQGERWGASCNVWGRWVGRHSQAVILSGGVTETEVAGQICI